MTSFTCEAGGDSSSKQLQLFTPIASSHELDALASEVAELLLSYDHVPLEDLASALALETSSETRLPAATDTYSAAATNRSTATSTSNDRHHPSPNSKHSHTQRNFAQAFDMSVHMLTNPPTKPANKHSNNSPISIACRKRLTATTCRSAESVRALMERIEACVECGEWGSALNHTLQFCCSDASEGAEWTSLPDETPPRTLTVILSYHDFANMCAALFVRVSNRQPGSPPLIFQRQSDSTIADNQNKTISVGAREIRQVMCDLQTLLLMCMASGLEVSTNEQVCMRGLVSTILFCLVWHPNTLEALASTFFTVDGQSTNDSFCSFLLHWGGTGVLQLVFEVFFICLARQGRIQAALWLLSRTKLGETLLRPCLALKPQFANQLFLPEVGDILIARTEILSRLRFPVGALVDILFDVCTAEMTDVSKRGPWIFETAPENIFISLLPLILSKRLSDEYLVNRGWHSRTRMECPLASFSPEEVLQLALKQRSLPQMSERMMLGEPDSAYEHLLDELIPAFVFLADPTLRQRYLQAAPWQQTGAVFRASYPSVVVPDFVTAFPNGGDTEVHVENSYLLHPEMISLWQDVNAHLIAAERYTVVYELACRISEKDFVMCNGNPFEEVLESHQRESQLQMARRTVTEITECRLGRIDLCYLRLMEAYESIYGQPSQTASLIGTKKRFHQSLNMSSVLHKYFLLPLMSGNLFKASKSSHWKSIHSHERARTEVAAGNAELSFVFPTLLPVHVARLLPAWLAGRGLSESDGRTNCTVGWRVLGQELIVCASKVLPHYPENPVIASHLEQSLLMMYLPLYVAAGNPRAFHLLERLAASPTLPEPAIMFSFRGCEMTNFESYVGALLEAASASDFALFAQSAARMLGPFSEPLSERVLQVYLKASDGLRAARFMAKISDAGLKERLSVRYGTQIAELLTKVEQVVAEGKAYRPGKLQDSKEERLRMSLRRVKDLASQNDLQGAVKYFESTRASNVGLLDISVANKIMHLCVTNNQLEHAEAILKSLREDSHNEINAMDFIPGACVRPDVVTCNILIKGYAREKPPRLDDIDNLIRQMESPFHLGGDGVKADQVTFNTAINAAVSAGDLNRAWSYFTMMKDRKIKIDVFTCGLLIKHFDASTSPTIVEEVCRLVEELDACEDATLLASMVDVYARFRDSAGLKRLLDKYVAKVANPSPFALATLVKGYSRCGRPSRAAHLWRRLEERSDVRWTAYILGCGTDLFASTRDVVAMLQVAERARLLNVTLSSTQYSSIIRTCIGQQKHAEALLYYTLMRGKGLRPCDMTYNNLIHTCVQAGDLNTAVDMLTDMSANAEHQPDIVTYSTIIKGLCDQGAMNAAMQVFSSLPAKGLTRDSVTYNTVLEGYAKLGDAEAVERIFNIMLNSDAKPTCFTLTILVKFYGRRHKVDSVIHLVDTLPEVYKFQVDTYVYTAAIAACAWNGRLDDALKYLQRMRSSFGAGTRTYGTLIAGSVKSRDWRTLSQVLRFAEEDRCQLDKREICVLKDVHKEWCANTLSQQWLHGGFNAASAEILKSFLVRQRRNQAKAFGKGLQTRQS